MTMTLSLPPAAHAGQALSEIDTPALLLDLDAFERNLERMQSVVSAAGLALRPHTKAHKCPQIALRQIALGAVGVCCQKISEAIPFVEAGVRDIHISNEIGSPQKARLLARLARHARVSACVDDPLQLQWLQEALEQADARMALLVEVDIGQGRCGVADDASCLRLAEAIGSGERFHFAGVQAYHGAVQHVRSYRERRDIALRAAERAAAFVGALAVAGIRCQVVTGGGTGSVAFDLESGVYTEVQPGSYVFMDGDYGRNEWQGELRFEQALFLASAVMSRTVAGRAVLDAGLKSVAVDSGLPELHDAPGLAYVAANDEHGIVAVADGAGQPALGDLLLLVPGHCDPTLNLHDELVGFRAGCVESVWAVAARGLSR